MKKTITKFRLWDKTDEKENIKYETRNSCEPDSIAPFPGPASADDTYVIFCNVTIVLCATRERLDSIVISYFDVIADRSGLGVFRQRVTYCFCGVSPSMNRRRPNENRTAVGSYTYDVIMDITRRVTSHVTPGPRLIDPYDS